MNKQVSVLVALLVFGLGFCGCKHINPPHPTEIYTRHYVDNQTDDSCTVAFKLVEKVGWKVLAYEVGVPAHTRVDVLEGYGLDCRKPSKLYDYFYVLSVDGDTLMNLTPMHDDVWEIETVTEDYGCCLLEGERWVLYLR
ncbi:MAG: hypothetical protein ACI30J_05950 [Paludibacteraceae bacterium]